jgi:hypothetical protein
MADHTELTGTAVTDVMSHPVCAMRGDVTLVQALGCPIGMVTGGDLIGLMAQVIPGPPIARVRDRAREGRPA